MYLNYVKLKGLKKNSQFYIYSHHNKDKYSMVRFAYLSPEILNEEKYDKSSDL